MGKDVNASIELAPTYLSAVEKGKQQLPEEKLRALAELLEFDENAIAEMIRLRGEALGRGWWSQAHGALLRRSPAYVRLRAWRGGSGSPRPGADDPPTKADRAGSGPVALRHGRGSAAPANWWPCRAVEQLRHLSNLINQHEETLDLRIVPFTATGNDAMGGSNFYMLAFPGGNLPTLAWQEVRPGACVSDEQRTGPGVLAGDDRRVSQGADMTTAWRKATASSDNSHCVKIRFDGQDVLLGDTKNHHLGDDEPVLRLPFENWCRTLAALRLSR